jgi:predicted  nucleic acid-binding Zn-ribbon protein
MDKVEAMIAAIDYKSRKIVEKCSNLKVENAVLKERIFALESQLNDVIDKNKKLEYKYKQEKIGENITHSEIAESKTKINELVRKIDRCITLITSDKD